MDSSDDGECRHDPAATLELVKAAHRSGGRVLTREELIEWIERPIYCGRPRPAKVQRGIELLDETIAALQSSGQAVRLELQQIRDNEARLIAELEAARKRAPGAGRPTTRTQYYLGAKLRSNLFHKLIRLPRLRLGAGVADEAKVVTLAHRLLLEGVRRKGRGGLVAKIIDQLQQNAVDSAIRMLARPGEIPTVPSRTKVERILKKHRF